MREERANVPGPSAGMELSFKRATLLLCYFLGQIVRLVIRWYGGWVVGLK